jgi:hypothetical protein
MVARAQRPRTSLGSSRSRANSARHILPSFRIGNLNQRDVYFRLYRLAPKVLQALYGSDADGPACS